MFAVSCTDGTFRFMTRSGREEKKINGHEGAIIVIKWSHDGTALLTAGEDGELKTWSKSGNLRASLVSTGQSIYGATWSPDDEQILLTNGKSLMVKSIQVRKKDIQWNAHDGIVLCIDWNVSNGLIISGGEDCIYRVWDAFGRQFYSSRPMEHVVTSLSWAPNGECYAVGSYNVIRLCDKIGWSYCRERITAGSVMNIEWTSDGTQFAGAGGNGSIIFAQVVDRKYEWKNYEVTLLETRKIRVNDIINESLEDLEFARDRIVDIGIGFDHLIVTTTTQCYIYILTNLNTPIIFDIRAPSHFIHLSKTCFLLLDLIAGIQIYNYEGKIVSSPKFQGLRYEYVTKDMVALSCDSVAIVDTVDLKTIQIFDTITGRLLMKLTHTIDILNIVFNQHNLGINERLLAYCDRSRDLYLTNISQTNNISYKLHSQVESYLFNDETDVLIGFSDGRFNTWYTPSIALLDKDLISLTISSVDSSEYGRNPQIVSYTGNRILIRKIDGSVLYIGTNIDISLLYDLVRTNRWEELIRLCRHQKNNILWGALAAMALTKKQLDAAEIALCELNEVAKVSHTFIILILF